MKKIISLIASVAMLATMVSSVFAADINNNAPVVENTVVEMSAEEYEGMMGAPLGENQHAYMITVNASGFDLQSVAGSGFNAAKRNGVLLSGIDYKLVFEDPSKLLMAMAMDDGLATSKPDEVYCAASFGSAPAMYPVIDNGDTTGKTITAEDNLYINTFMAVTEGEVKATIAAEFTIVPFASFKAGAQKVFRNDNKNISYTVNGEAATAITFGAEGGEEDDGTLKIEISEAMPITADDVNGIAWDVAFKNFDSTKEYKAFFTSNGVARNPAGQRIEFDIETDADFGFAAILKKVQLGAEDTVDFQIKY